MAHDRKGRIVISSLLLATCLTLVFGCDTQKPLTVPNSTVSLGESTDMVQSTTASLPTNTPACTDTPQSTNSPLPTDTARPTNTHTIEPMPTKAKPAKIGELIEINGLEFKVHQAERNHKYVFAEVEVGNATRSTDVDCNPFYFTVRDSDGYKHNMVFTTSSPGNGLDAMKLEAGTRTRGWVAFDVNGDEKGLVLSFNGNWSGSDLGRVYVDLELDPYDDAEAVKELEAIIDAAGTVFATIVAPSPSTPESTPFVRTETNTPVTGSSTAIPASTPSPNATQQSEPSSSADQLPATGPEFKEYLAEKYGVISEQELDLEEISVYEEASVGTNYVTIMLTSDGSDVFSDQTENAAMEYATALLKDTIRFFGEKQCSAYVKTLFYSSDLTTFMGSDWYHVGHWSTSKRAWPVWHTFVNAHYILGNEMIDVWNYR